MPILIYYCMPPRKDKEIYIKNSHRGPKRKANNFTDLQYLKSLCLSIIMVQHLRQKLPFINLKNV